MDSLKKNRLVIAAVLVALLLGLWAWLRQQRMVADAPRENTESLASLLPSLERDAIHSVEITKPDDGGTVVLKQQAGRWRVTAPVDGDADQEQVGRVLDRLADLTVEKVVSENSENHERLEVTDEKALQVKVLGEDGGVLADLRIGAVSGGRTIVRQAEETQVVAVADSIKYAFNHDLRSWRNRKVTQEDPATVTAIHFTSAEGSALRFTRTNPTSWEPAEGERPIDRFDGSKVQNTVASLSKLTATDFAAPEITLEGAGLGDGATRVALHLGAAEDAGEAEEDATSSSDSSEAPAAARTIALRVSEAGPAENQHYLVREGQPQIFVISSYHFERIQATKESFQADDPEEDGAN